MKHADIGTIEVKPGAREEVLRRTDTFSIVKHVVTNRFG
jgi:hypothetical protein